MRLRTSFEPAGNNKFVGPDWNFEARDSDPQVPIKYHPLAAFLQRPPRSACEPPPSVQVEDFW
jgi:hypothetical protein